MANRNNNSANLPRARRRNLGLARAENPGGGQMVLRAIEKSASLVNSVSGAIGNELDDIAVREGDIAGRKAGADPGFDFADAPNPVTLRGKSFERSAVRTAVNRLDGEAQAAIGKLTIEHGHDPAVLQGEIAAYKESLISGLPDMLQPDVAAQVDRWGMAAVSKATITAQNVQLEADRAASLSLLSRRIDSLSLVARAEADPSQRQIALTQELNALEALLVEYGPKEAFTFGGTSYGPDEGRAGHFSPEAMVKLLDGALATAAEARALAPLDYMTSAAEVRAYGEELVAAEIEKGEDSRLGQSGLTRVSNHIDRRIRELDHTSKKEVAALRHDLGDLDRLVSGGFAVGDNRIDAVRQKALALGDFELADDANDLKDLAAYGSRARTLNQTELNDDLTRRRAAAGADVTVPQARQIQTGERILATMTKGLQTDPLGWAAHAGTVAVQPLDFGQPLPDQLKVRRKQADDVAAYYGVNSGLFRPGERDQIAEVMADADSSQAVAFMRSIHDGFGDRALDAFREFKDKDPAFAYLGGLATLGPDQEQTAVEALTGQRALTENKDLLPESADFEELLDDELGTAYGFSPQTRGQVISSAKGLIATRRLRGGPDIEEDRDAIRDAIQRAAGGTVGLDGVARGGVGAYNGREVSVPPTMARDDFEDTISSLTDDDLQRLSVGQTAPIFANGSVLKARDLEDVYLISVGPGRYWLSTTDPASGNPRLLGGGGNDGLYVLDLSGGV